MDERRESFAQRDRLLTVEQRHELAIAPHVRSAARESVARPGARLVEIVAGEEGSAAGTEMMGASRIERRRPARHGTLEVGKIGHRRTRPLFLLVPKELLV